MDQLFLVLGMGVLLRSILLGLVVLLYVGFLFLRTKGNNHVLVQTYDKLFRLRHAFKLWKTLPCGARLWVASDAVTRQHFDTQFEAVAFTIGESIYLPHKRIDASVIRHELKHVEQHRKGGLFFTMDYWWESITKGYSKNRYERAARRAEKKPKKKR